MRQPRPTTDRPSGLSDQKSIESAQLYDRQGSGVAADRKLTQVLNCFSSLSKPKTGCEQIYVICRVQIFSSSAFKCYCVRHTVTHCVL